MMPLPEELKLGFAVPPMLMRPVLSGVKMTRLTGSQGKNKSFVLTAVPLGVETETCPDVAVIGIAAVMLVDVTELSVVNGLTLSLTRLFAITSKFVPVIATVPLTFVIVVGLSPLIVGAALELETV